MARIQTTFRIEHKTKQERKKFEAELDKALKRNMYKTRVEWIKEKVREIIKNSPSD